ncbi:hypothetical protein EC950183_2902, partial [Escherichia coli 95.0183]
MSWVREPGVSDPSGTRSYTQGNSTSWLNQQPENSFLLSTD